MLIHTPQTLALFISNDRKNRKLSQAAIGDLVGLKQKTISAFENKPESTKLETLFEILSAMEMELHIIPKNNKHALTSKQHEW